MQRTKFKISDQVKAHVEEKEQLDPAANVSSRTFISTGSTLLDLAISGEVRKGGGIPSGILVEISGPPGCGKTVLLCEIAGAIQRQGGEIRFCDPEARLSKNFARLFNVEIDDDNYFTPDTVTEVFTGIREWKPTNPSKVNGLITDSLAALSTSMEIEDKDAMGMRRAKEFSQELRKTCRVIKNQNLLMVCSNQVRINVNATQYEQKYLTSGGMGIPFYASLRLRCSNPQKIKKTKKVRGRDVVRVVGVETEIYVEKNSIAKPYRSATVPIIFDYGIDDIRQNLQFLKENTGAKVYGIDDIKFDRSLDVSCQAVEQDNLQKKLRVAVIRLWQEIEESFHIERLPKRRNDGS